MKELKAPLSVTGGLGLRGAVLFLILSPELWGQGPGGGQASACSLRQSSDPLWARRALPLRAPAASPAFLLCARLAASC